MVTDTKICYICFIIKSINFWFNEHIIIFSLFTFVLLISKLWLLLIFVSLIKYFLTVYLKQILTFFDF